MSKLKLRNDLIVSILLVILVFSISSSISLTKADAGGTGKYVTLSFVGADPQDPQDPDFYVTATKDASGQSWIYPDPEGEMTQKLGAGTITLVATCPDGYSVTWRLGKAVDINDPTFDEVIENEDSIVFKSTKYAYIEVTFTKLYTLDIEYSDTTNPDWGSWEIVRDELYDPDADAYQEGAEVTILFTPNSEIGCHLSLVLDNGRYANLIQTDLTTKYSITFHEDHNVIVAFDEYGETTVPLGSGVTVFLGNEIGIGSLYFTGTSDGTATGGPLPIEEGDGTSIIFWRIDAGDFAFNIPGEDYVIVSIPVDEVPSYVDFHLYTADDRNALWSDIDGDGSVTHDDMVEVAIAINDNGREYSSKYDVNADGTLNQTDIETVKDYIGTTLTEVVPAPEGWDFDSEILYAQWMYDAENELLLILTPHFSIFRGR
ncbi:hypothetical protein E2P60_03620 [Candidatus Bathyarchaeota archaeon]|nr:hypothetical protein E2P60_03620 [Candidatus Bathyarchaeota archaeon]